MIQEAIVKGQELLAGRKSHIKNQISNINAKRPLEITDQKSKMFKSQFLGPVRCPFVFFLHFTL